jgi:hypothetical protein
MNFKDATKLLHADELRSDGRIERHCEHGIGHTVGHLDNRKLAEKFIWVHGCDGCCDGWPCEKEEQSKSE